MKRMMSVIAVAVATATLLVACEPAECSKMQSCCDAISSEPWVGNACELTSRAHGGTECKAVFDAILVSAQSGEHQLPSACQ
jgi:hypothetical protein